MRVPERRCVAGCGRPAERGDRYCLACQLDGTAPELGGRDAEEDLETIMRLQRRGTGRDRCPECGAEFGAYTYHKSGRGLVVERRCPNRGQHMTERSRRAQRV